MVYTVDENTIIIEVQRETFSDTINVNGYKYTKENYDEKMSKYIENGGDIYYSKDIKEIHKLGIAGTYSLRNNLQIGKIIGFNDYNILCKFDKNKIPNITKNSAIAMVYSSNVDEDKNAHIESIVYLDLFLNN